MSDRPRHTIRRLTPGDVKFFRDLLDVFGGAFDEAGTYTDSQPSDGYLTELLCSEQFIAVAAFRSGAVIGGLTAYELKKFEQERSEIYIYDLAVVAAHRRRGVATQLIARLKSIASERGAYVVVVQADHGDEPAIRLYSKLGARKDVLHFDIDVD